jgi:hypothetical protein
MVLSDMEHCDLCVKESEAVIACKQCLVKLCEDHWNSHLITKTTANHTLLPLIQLDKETALDIEKNEIYLPFESICEIHQVQVSSKYCTRCDELCCIECESSSTHSDHVLKSFDNVRSNLIMKFEQDQLPASKMKLEKLLTVLKEIEVWEMKLIQYILSRDW